MTQDEIISMAEQAGWLVIGENIYSPSSVGEDEDLIEEINALVKLAAEHEREKHNSPSWETVDDAIAAEREACAKVCDEWNWSSKHGTNPSSQLAAVAAAIRARG